jgi:hypothetical protein
VSLYHLINIDRNVDVDNKNYTKSEEKIKKKLKKKVEKKQIKKSKTNHNSLNSLLNDNSISFINNYFNKNESKIFNIKRNNIKYNKTQISLNPYEKIKKQKINSNSNAKSSKSHLMTSLEEKEMKELEECCFRPKINKPKKLLRNIYSFNSFQNLNTNNLSLTNKRIKESRFEKLYNDKEKYKMSKEIKSIELENIASSKVTFFPEIKNKIIRLNSDENFFKRQEKFLQNKQKHSAEIKKNIDTKYENICSFNPKISNYKFIPISNKEKSNKNIFIRLYQDSKKRLDSQAQLEIEKMNKIVDLSNILNPDKNFDIDTINRLYENKEKQNVIIKTKEKVEKEEGITFKPNIVKNCFFKNINANFFKRNQIMNNINHRSNNCEEENKKQQETFIKKYNKNEYTKEQRKKIISNIINRLYNDSMQIKRSSNNIINKNTRSAKSFL